MNFTKQIIRRIELPKFIGKASNVFVKYPSPIVALILLTALMYLLYFIIIIRNFATMPFDIAQSYKNITYTAAILASFLVIFSRNKFKDRSQMFFFLNSSVKAHEIVIGGYAVLYISYLIIIKLMFVPFLFLFWHQGRISSIFDVIVLFFLLTLVFCVTSMVWIIATILIKYLQSKSKDQFYLTSVLHVGILGCILYPVVGLIEKYGFNNYFSLSIVFIVFILGLRWVLIRTSTDYLNIIFIQLNNEGSHNKKQSLDFQHKNGFYLNLKLELLNFLRNQILKEQSLIFIFLIVISFILFNTFSYVDFVVLNSYLINFGLKEIYILFSLTVGMSYRRYRNTNYLLNLKQATYFNPRIVLVLLINLLIHIMFTGINNLLIGDPLSNLVTFSTLCSIVFITMFSMAIGFSVNINEGNKAIIIILAIVFVNIYDFVTFSIFNSIVYVNLLNSVISIFLYFYIEIIYLRKPFFK